MAVAAFKDLCLDAGDAAALGGFWSAVLGLPLEVHDDGDAVVRGGPLHDLWINAVPEAKWIKNRVHLDLYGASSEPLLAAGATVVDDHDGWSVLADPEGNELCLFPDPEPVPEGGPPARPFAVCVDSAEPEALAAWWASVLGGSVGPGSDGTPRWIHEGAGFGTLVLKCVRVADRRVVKNRCHWDVTARSVDALVEAGATVLRPPGGVISWTVLADPQGNEFCAFVPP